MWSHSHHPDMLEKQRETAQEGTELPISFQHPLSPFKLQPIISPLKPCPGFADQTSVEVPVSRDMRIPPMVGVPLPVQAQLTEQQPHLELRIPPGAGREKLNKTLGRDDYKKNLSHHSWGS